MTNYHWQDADAQDLGMNLSCRQHVAVSVIVPVYNVARYLTQCLDSICNQSLQNIEIIVVNDGSTDSSRAIIDSFSKRDSRVIALHQRNRGYGAAVNSGIDRAKGKYISIVESDDWIEPSMLETLLIEGEITGATIIKAGFTKVFDNGKSQDVGFGGICDPSGTLIDPTSSLELMVFPSSIWSAIYLRSEIEKHKIKMPETTGASYQDVVWKFLTFTHMRSLRLIDTSLYNYRFLSTGSSSTKKDNVNAHFHNYELIKSHLLRTGNWNYLKRSYYVHQFIDFVFHSNRLSRTYRLQFFDKAIAVISEAASDGINPYKTSLTTGNRFYRRRVLSLIARIEYRHAVHRRKFAAAFLSLIRSAAHRIDPFV